MPSIMATLASPGGGFGSGSQSDDLPELKILVTNVHGLHQGCGELSVLATTATPHLLCIMETHFLNGYSGSSFSPARFVSVARVERSEHGGGILIFCARICFMMNLTLLDNYYVQEKAGLCAVCFSGIIVVYGYSKPSPSDVTFVEQLTALYDDFWHSSSYYCQ